MIKKFLILDKHDFINNHQKGGFTLFLQFYDLIKLSGQLLKEHNDSSPLMQVSIILMTRIMLQRSSGWW